MNVLITEAKLPAYDIDEPVTFIDRVARPDGQPAIPIPELSFSPDDPASLYARRLTHLEVQVILLIADGYDFRQIAARRRIRQRYVRDLVKSACRKLGCRNRYALILAWECELFHVGLRELGLLPYSVKPRK